MDDHKRFLNFCSETFIRIIFIIRYLIDTLNLLQIYNMKLFSVPHQKRNSDNYRNKKTWKNNKKK